MTQRKGRRESSVLVLFEKLSTTWVSFDVLCKMLCRILLCWCLVLFEKLSTTWVSFDVLCEMLCRILLCWCLVLLGKLSITFDLMSWVRCCVGFVMLVFGCDVGIVCVFWWGILCFVFLIIIMTIMHICKMSACCSKRWQLQGTER